MAEQSGGWVNAPCPWLPQVGERHDYRLTRRHGTERGLAYYRDATAYAQSQWMVGKPAQALLQLNKAWSAELRGDAWRQAGGDPWRALGWMIVAAEGGDCGFMGNPVRHFQHLASRMSGPRAVVRSWRAWAGMHLAERLLSRAAHPRDGRQLAREGLWVPGLGRCLSALELLGWDGEAEAVVAALEAPSA